MRKVITSAIVLICLSVLWYFISPVFTKVILDEERPKTTETLQNGLKRSSLGVISSADFIPSAHDVKGQAKLIEDVKGDIYLRFENFEIINGPDVRVYLAKDIENTESIEVGPLKGTHGNFNYLVPSTVNLEDYSKVLVWCDDFSVLFAHADFVK